MMLIRCPNCDSTHEVPASLLGEKPRKMRCAVCRTVFEAKAENADSRIPSGGMSAAAPASVAATPAVASAPVLPNDADDPLIGDDFAAPSEEAAALDQSAIDAAMSVDDIDALFDDPVPASAAEVPLDPFEAALTGPEEPEPETAPVPAEAALAAGAAASAAAAAVAAAREHHPDPQSKKRNPHGRAKSQPGGMKRTLGLVAATGFGTLIALAIFRHETVRLAPSLAPAFELFGLEVNSTGLEIHGVRSHLLREDFRDTLEVTGQIVNITRMRQPVPLLRLSLHAADGSQLYVWTATADHAEIGPGEKALFRRRLASPPKDADQVMVRFVSRDDIVASVR